MVKLEKKQACFQIRWTPATKGKGVRERGKTEKKMQLRGMQQGKKQPGKEKKKEKGAISVFTKGSTEEAPSKQDHFSRQ